MANTNDLIDGLLRARQSIVTMSVGMKMVSDHLGQSQTEGFISAQSFAAQEIAAIDKLIDAYMSDIV